MSEAHSKASPHGATPHNLEEYWVHGEGAGKIGGAHNHPSTPGEAVAHKARQGRK